MKILIVEDDSTISYGLKYCLELENFSVTAVDNYKDALNSLNNIDLVLLDINLEEMDGFTLFKKIKEIKNIPIIFLTANDLETSIVMGLDMGADDYITKPFKTRELIARIKNVLRRNNNAEIIKIKDIKIDLKQAKVFRNEIDTQLTSLEYKIFLLLALNPNKVFTREQLLKEIWDINSLYVYDNTLTVYIKRIREKLNDNGEIIKTVRGMGYKISD